MCHRINSSEEGRPAGFEQSKRRRIVLAQNWLCFWISKSAQMQRQMQLTITIRSALYFSYKSKFPATTHDQRPDKFRSHFLDEIKWRRKVPRWAERPVHWAKPVRGPKVCKENVGQLSLQRSTREKGKKKKPRIAVKERKERRETGIEDKSF